jgi:hypothetical protein
VLHSDAVASSVNVVDSLSATVFTVTAKNKGTEGNNIRVIVSAGLGAETYNVVVAEEVSNAQIVRETYKNVVISSSLSGTSDYIESVINTVSAYVTVSVADGTKIPVASTYPLISGSDGGSIIGSDYDVMAAFGSIDRPLVIFAPAVNQIVGATDAATVYSSAIADAELFGSSFVVVETPANLSAADAVTYVGGLTETAFAAAYYPHLYIADPVGRSNASIRKVGPSGAVAGNILSTDASRGVFKAPAGLGNALSGFVALETTVSGSDIDTLQAGVKPLNPIRQIPGSGFVVMGARTLKQDGTANRYINMRRSLSYIHKTLQNTTQFAVFENNDPRLWSQLKTSISVFLTQYFNNGGLAGSGINNAFYVKVDAENNTPTSIRNGEVHIEVGVALQYPAEFVVINLTQKTSN